MHSLARIVADLNALGLRPGGILLVHTSFRSLGDVEKGPLGLIAALETAVGVEGTLVMPTMTDGEGVFDPRFTKTVSMGITAELFWRQPGVVRSTHPGGSFAAKGPAAIQICAPQPLSPPHGIDSPPGRVYARGGQVLLLGVQHSESTVLHVAEDLADVPYGVEHPCMVEENGVAVRKMVRETDHCCRGFRKLEEWMPVRVGRVGDAQARLVDARQAVDVAVEHLRREPLVFLCPPSARCEECDVARASKRRAG